MTADDNSRSQETHLAARNALKLGSSLLVTGGVAIAMRLLLPRYLGPERFGVLSFADAFAATFFVALSLGADVYVRKHVSVRPEHASDFFGGTFVLRALVSAGILAIMAVVMALTDRPVEVRVLVYVLAFAQFFVNANATLSALLHAKGAVGAMSVLAVATKVAWAAGTLLAILTHADLWAFAAALLVSEMLECAALFYLARRHLGLVFRVNLPATKAMVVSSLPYYLNTVASTAYGKLGLTLLGLVAASTVEVGYYAAASAVAGLTLLATPLIEWVLMPTFARAATRSADELFARIRGTTEVILALAIPAALLLSLAAPLCVETVFGVGFEPAALALRILAPTFVITYIAIVYAITLLMLNRPWTLTLISIAGLGVNLLLNLALVRPSMAFFGEGGGGAGSALAMLGTETFVTASMIAIVGRRAFDRRIWLMLMKSLGACVLVVAIDHVTLGMGATRHILEGAVYLVVVIAVRAVPTAEIADVLRVAVARKRAGPASRVAVAVSEGGT